MNVVLGGKKPIFLFAEKPAIAPPVFVFQKDKGQKVRATVFPLQQSLRLFPPPQAPPAFQAFTLSWEDGSVAVGHRGDRSGWTCVDRTRRPCFKNSGGKLLLNS